MNETKGSRLDPIPTTIIAVWEGKSPFDLRQR